MNSTDSALTFPVVDLTVSLPELTGSAKQTQWAEQIRGKLLNEAASVLMSATTAARDSKADPEQFAIGRADLVARIQKLADVSEAKWWIDVARFQPVRTLLKGA